MREEMDYKSFCSQIGTEIGHILPDEYSVHVHDVLKNNGHLVTEVSLSTPDSQISPALPMERFFDEYMANDDMTIQDMAAKVASRALDACLKMPDWGMDVTKLLDHDNAEGRIVAELINIHQNEELLRQVPHVDVNEDLAEVFRIIVAKDASVLIRNEHLPRLEMDVNDLVESSRNNNVSKYNFTDMAFMFPKGLMPEGMMYVGTARDVETGELANYGASCIADQAFMEEVTGRLGDDYAIIPSSIHEVIFINIEDGMDANQIAAMIRDVNTAELRPEEVLSDRAYMYDYEHSRVITMEEGLQMRELRQQQEQEMNRNVADPQLGIA